MTIDGATKTIEAIIQHIMPDDEFNKELDAHIHFVESYFKDPNKSFMPQLVLITNRKERMVCMLADMPDTSEARHKMMFNIMKKIGQDQLGKKKHGLVIAMFFMSEAWMRGQTHKGEKISLPIADNPVKTEVITIAGMTADRRVNFAMIPMLRSDKGIVILDTKHTTKSPYKQGNRDMQTYILEEAYRGYAEGLGN